MLRVGGGELARRLCRGYTGLGSRRFWENILGRGLLLVPKIGDFVGLDGGVIERGGGRILHEGYWKVDYCGDHRGNYHLCYGVFLKLGYFPPGGDFHIQFYEEGSVETLSLVSMKIRDDTYSGLGQNEPPKPRV